MLGFGKHRSALSTVIALSLSTAVPAAAGPFSGVIVFGDSLIDSGNVQAASAQLEEEDPTPAALGYFEGDTIVWVWIGTHAEYDRLLGQR